MPIKPRQADIRCSTVCTLAPACARPVQRGFGHQRGTGRQFDDRIEVGATKHDAGIHRRRAQRQKHLFPAMQTHAGGADHVLEGAFATWFRLSRTLELRLLRRKLATPSARPHTRPTEKRAGWTRRRAMGQAISTPVLPQEDGAGSMPDGAGKPECPIVVLRAPPPGATSTLRRRADEAGRRRRTRSHRSRHRSAARWCRRA